MFPADTGTAVVDEPITSTPEPGGGAPDSGEPADPGVDPISEPADGGSPDEPDPQEGDEDFIVQGGRLGAKTKEALAQIKATNPRLARELSRALFAQERYKQELPGGLQELAELKSTVEKLGGADGIAKFQKEYDQYNDIDQRFTNADPKFIDDLTGNPEGQASFLKLAPAMIQKFEELDPDGFSGFVARIFSADMGAANLPLTLERLGDFIGENPKAQELLASVKGYMQRINQFAAKQPTAPQPKREQPNAEFDRRAADLSKRETEIRQQEYSTVSRNASQSIFNSEWDRQTKGLGLTKDQVQTVKELYQLRMGAIAKDKTFSDNLNRLFTADDRAGFNRYVTSAYQKHIPEVLKQVLRRVVPRTATATAAKPSSQNPGAQNPPAASATVAKTPTPERGFTNVAGIPAAADVDYSRTTRDMWINGQAVLKNGRKVQFQR